MIKGFILIALLLIGIFSCNSRSLVDRDEITALMLVDGDNKISIDSKDSIRLVANNINLAKKNPAIFISKYKVIVCYKKK